MWRLDIAHQAKSQIPLWITTSLMLKMSSPRRAPKAIQTIHLNVVAMASPPATTGKCISIQVLAPASTTS